MEWLQTQKIGKALLQSGSKIEDAYYQSYRQSKNKQGQDIKPCIINITVDTVNESLGIEQLSFANDKIRTNNFFTSISGNFTSYYLCNSYLKCSSILDFLGIDGEKIVIDEKEGKPNGLKKVLAEMDKSRGSQHINSILISARDRIRKSENLCKKIGALIKGIGFVVEQSKKLEKLDKLDFFSEVEINGFKNFSKINFFPKDSKKGTDEVVFVILTVDSIRLSQSDDYKNFCLDRFLHLAQIDKTKAKAINDPFNGTNQTFEVSFPRDSINLLKSATGSPTTIPNMIGTGFVLSEKSYNELKLGSKKIDNELKIRIAGISHYIIPEFTGDFEIQYFQNYLKDSLSKELAFSREEFEKTERSFLLNTKRQINAILLLGYIKGKGDIDFVNSIRIPSLIYFERLKRELNEAKSFIDKEISLSFQKIFYLFPVASDKSKKPDALFFYKSIFEHTPYDKNTLMNVYADLIHLYRYGRPYEKAGRKYYGGTVNITYTEKPEYFVKISNATLKFQVLLNLLKNLFKENNSNTMDYSSLPPKTQKVFERCNYQEDKAALFYLGKLIRLAADAQAKKQKNKRRPILDKINYGGMKPMDLKWLFAETIEKLKQYEVIRYADDDLTMFKTFFDSAEQNWTLTDIENVFYIFSGYALYWEVREKIPSSLSKLVAKSEQDEEDSDVDNDEEIDADEENED
ncbi:TM1802 family CRISPR-associated protein [Runella sp.]|uniref:TM1802 family CRISPR-associated protein n=1 Tax=Runella sp. TaxID=1960881 RepID=UPI0026169C00|nr:TM1802 family CRISPR-associated protein [Runella sp.]